MDFINGPIMDDRIDLSNFRVINDSNLTDVKSEKYKYSEDQILKELTDYIAGTYRQHYSAGDDKIQTWMNNNCEIWEN